MFMDVRVCCAGGKIPHPRTFDLKTKKLFLFLTANIEESIMASWKTMSCLSEK